MFTKLVVVLPNGTKKETTMKFDPEFLLDMGVKFKSVQPNSYVAIKQGDVETEIELPTTKGGK